MKVVDFEGRTVGEIADLEGRTILLKPSDREQETGLAFDIDAVGAIDIDRVILKPGISLLGPRPRRQSG